MVGVTLATVLFVSTLVASQQVQVTANDSMEDLYDTYEAPSPYDSRIQSLIENKRSITAIKRLIDRLDNNLGKRMCDLGGGLSAACNNKDLINAREHHRFLVSPFAPGKRSRSPPPPHNSYLN